MKLLLLIFLTLSLYTSDLNQSIISNKANITSLKKEVESLKKENIQLKSEIEKVDWKRDNDKNDINNRVESFGNYLEENGKLISVIIGSLGILMTVLVLIITLKSNKEAKLVAKDEAENKIEKWIENEAKDFMSDRVDKAQEEIHKDTNIKVEELLKQYEEKIQVLQIGIEKLQKKSNKEIENLKERLEEKGNEFLDNLSSKIMENDIADIELSIEDKKYFEYQVKAIKSKPLKQRNLQDYRKIILFYIADKDYQRAFNLVNKLLDNEKYNNVEKSILYHLKGLIEEKQNLFDNAILSFNISIELYPNNIKAYTAKAKIYNIEKYDYEEAIKLANKALSIDTNNYEAYISLGYANRNKAYNEKKTELYEEAIEYNKKAIEINPDFELAYNNIASIYLMRHKYKKAREWYYLALKANKNEWVYINLFRSYLILGEPFPKQLEEEYLLHINQKNPSVFSKYKMLKILQNIINNKYKNKKDIDDAIQNWAKNNQIFRHYFFFILKTWIEKETDENKKENLQYALNLFDEYWRKKFLNKTDT